MRIVLDTNVLISAALKEKSLPAMAVSLAARRHTLLKSAVTERELLEVMARPQLASLIAPAFRDWLGATLAAAELVPITQRIVACRDPRDDKFLELAVNGQSDLIVSGDADLLALHPFRGIAIVTPAAFAQGAAR